MLTPILLNKACQSLHRIHCSLAANRTRTGTLLRADDNRQPPTPVSRIKLEGEGGRERERERERGG